MFLFYIVVAIISGAIASSIASRKGRGGCLFFGLGFLIGPIAVLVAAVMSRDEAAEQDAKLRKGDLVLCGACREPIHPEATICPHCRTPVIHPPREPSLAEKLGRKIGSGRRV